MESNKSLEEQNAEIKKPMSEAQWQRLINKSFYEQSLPVAILGGMLGGILMVVGAFLAASHLSFGMIVGQIGDIYSF